jgi:hypothetical protein
LPHDDTVGEHVPVPLHVWVVRLELAHVGGLQTVPPPGNMHAPVGEQSVAPQRPPVGLQAAVQHRLPVPLMPQIPLVH